MRFVSYTKPLARTFAVLLFIALLAFPFCPPAFAAGETEVNFRMVLLSPMSYADCSVFLDRYETATSEEPIDRVSFSVSRIDNWELKKKIEPGFYNVSFVTIDGLWDEDIFGSSERFEVKGDKMTVYVGVQDDDYPVTMPEHWLVYGEDNQNFYIWKTNDSALPDTDKPSEPADGDSPDVDPLPKPNTDVATKDDPADSGAVVSSYDQNNSPKQEPKLSAKIGTFIYMAAAVALLVFSILWLRKLKKRRGA